MAHAVDNNIADKRNVNIINHCLCRKNAMMISVHWS